MSSVVIERPLEATAVKDCIRFVCSQHVHVVHRVENFLPIPDLHVAADGLIHVHLMA